MAAEATIAIGIEDKTTRGSRGVISAFKKISTQAGKTTKDTKGLGGALSGLLGGKMRGVTTSLIGKAGMVGAFAAVGAAAGAATRQALLFTTAVAELSTLLPKGSQEVNKMAKASGDLARQFGDAPINQTKAFYQIISAGASDAAEATTILTVANKLAIGGVTDVTTAADGLTSALNAYGLEAEEAGGVSDAMFVAMRAGKTNIAQLSASIGSVAPLAAQAGASLDELLAATAALTKGGQSTSVAMTGMRAILAAVVKPTKEAKDMAAQLGLDFSAASLESKGFAKFIQEVATKTAGSSEKMAQLFGGVEALVPALALSGKAAKDFEQILSDMDKKAGQTEEALGKMMSTPQKQLDKLMSNLTVASDQFGNSILNALLPIISGLNEIIDKANAITTEEGRGSGSGRGNTRKREQEQRKTAIQQQPIKVGPSSGRSRREKALDLRGVVEGPTGPTQGDIANQQRQVAAEIAAKAAAESSKPVARPSALFAQPAPQTSDSSLVVPDTKMAFDLDVATPWLKGIEELGDRSEALRDSQFDLRIEKLKASDASAVDIAKGTAMQRMNQLHDLQVLEKKDLLQKGVTKQEITKIHKGERALLKARSDLRIKTAEQTEAERELTEARDAESAATQDAFSKISLFTNAMAGAGPEVDALVGVMQGMMSGGVLGAAVAGFSALPSLLGTTAEAAAEFRRQMEEVRKALKVGNDSANDVIDSLFGGDVKARQAGVFDVFQDWFDFFEGGGYTGITGNVNAVREMFERLARLDVGGSGALSDDSALFGAAGKGFDEFRSQIDEAFGSDSSFSDVGELFFDTSSAFDDLRISAESATTAVSGLSEAEKAAIHARFGGEAQGASARLQSKFSKAGGDAFAQRDAFKSFQREIASILAATRTAGGRTGGAAATGAATTTSNAAKPVSVTGGNVNAAVTASAQVTIDEVTITAEQLVALPSPDMWNDYWDVVLLSPVDAAASRTLLQVKANIAAHKIDITPTQLFGFGDAASFQSFWNLLGARATSSGGQSGDGGYGPVALQKQIAKNVKKDRDARLLTGTSMFRYADADSFKSFWTGLTSRATSSQTQGSDGYGPVAVQKQVAKNVKKDRDARLLTATSMFRYADAGSFKSFWTGLTSRATSGGNPYDSGYGPVAVQKQIASNVSRHRAANMLTPLKMFGTLPSGSAFSSFWDDLLSNAVHSADRSGAGGYGPVAVMKQVRANMSHQLANNPLTPASMFGTLPTSAEFASYLMPLQASTLTPASMFGTLPTSTEFATYLMPLQASIRSALQQVIGQMNKVTVRAADFISFDTSGVQDSIATVVQDAVDDRQFDDASAGGAGFGWTDNRR